MTGHTETVYLTEEAAIRASDISYQADYLVERCAETIQPLLAYQHAIYGRAPLTQAQELSLIRVGLHAVELAMNSAYQTGIEKFQRRRLTVETLDRAVRLMRREDMADQTYELADLIGKLANVEASIRSN
jgi:hypothetical protein